MIEYGFSQHVISPPSKQTMLAGFDKCRYAKEVADEIYVSALKLQVDNQTLLILAFDLTWVSSSFYKGISDWIHKSFKIAPENIVVAASHTHSSPETLEKTFYQPKLDPDYLRFLRDKTQQAIHECLMHQEEANLTLATLSHPISIHRRKKIIDKKAIKQGLFKFTVANRPNFKTPLSHLVQVIWVEPTNKRLPEIPIINFACHPTLMKEDAVSADFPGRVCSLLAGKVQNIARGLFLQGFCGNLSPRFIHKRKLKPSMNSIWDFLFDRWAFSKEVSSDELNSKAKLLADAICKAPRNPIQAPLLESAKIEVPLEHQPVNATTLDDTYGDTTETWFKDYRDYVLSLPKTVHQSSITIQYVKLSTTIGLLCVSGEVFHEYAEKISALLPKDEQLFCVGYANGMTGYIPTAKAITEGGYEPARSLRLFGLPSPFKQTIEQTILTSIQSLFANKQEEGL